MASRGTADVGIVVAPDGDPADHPLVPAAASPPDDGADVAPGQRWRQLGILIESPEIAVAEVERSQQRLRRAEALQALTATAVGNHERHPIRSASDTARHVTRR